MNPTLRKIGITLTFIIFLPALFFSIYELNSLNENEEIVESIYNNQLEAILYSINQFSEDVASGWASRINLYVNELPQIPADKQVEELDKLLAENNSIHAVFLCDLNAKKIDLFSSKRENITDEKKQTIKTVINNSKGEIRKLLTYKRGGYRKIHSLMSNELKENSLLLFILDNKDDEMQNMLCGIIIEPELFIKNILGPKLQAIAQNDFAIIISNTRYNKLMYSTDPDVSTVEHQKKSLWFLPQYSAGIALKGGTIQDLAKERSYTNMWLIGLLVIVLLMGVGFVFINIRKEIQLAQIKSDFVSNVSHELRTPLALISMFSETLEMGRVRTEEKKQEYYSVISQEATRLSRIVNKILNFSKMEAGKYKYNLSESDLNSIVNEVFNTYKFHLQNNGFKFSLNLTENIPFVKADCEAVSEAVVNLLDNAVKYSQEIKEVEINTGVDINLVYIEVKDKGIGILKEYQEKIFDKFFRITSGLVHNTKGTGLGLTIVKHIMEAHGGTVTLSSAPGNGSSFRLNFKYKN